MAAFGMMPIRPRRLVRRLVSTLATIALVGVACVPTPPARGDAGTSEPTTAPTTLAATVAPTPTGPTPPPSFIRPTPTPLPTFRLYTVVAGDTLSSIARTFETTARSIAFWNRDRYPSLDPDSPTYEPNRIAIGWVLMVIPGVEVDELELPERTPSPDPSLDPSPTAGGTG
jgi:nucleoid-associated protein YgaU